SERGGERGGGEKALVERRRRGVAKTEFRRADHEVVDLHRLLLEAEPPGAKRRLSLVQLVESARDAVRVVMHAAELIGVDGQGLRGAGPVPVPEVNQATGVLLEDRRHSGELRL